MSTSGAFSLIDWWLVASSALWIMGLSVLLAAFSYHDWLAHETGRRLRDQFKTRTWRIPFSLGMALFCTGLAATRGAAWWERLLWGALALSFGWQLTQHLRSR